MSSDSSQVATASRRASVPWPLPVAAVALVIVFVIYPPSHVVSRPAAASVGAASVATAFEPVGFATQFWDAQLQPAAAQATAAATVLTDLRRDPAGAAARYAQRVGLGSAAYYFVRGSGRVTAVERSRILVEIGGVSVAVRTGPVFGNVVRDGCGLLEVNQVPGLAEFNALSAELNKLVETRVQPTLKTAPLGATVVVAGCAEAPEALPGDGPLLTLVPVYVEVKP